MTATSHCCLLAIATIATGGRASVARADEGDDSDTESQVADESYPAQLSLRPLTLPQGMTQVAIGGGYWRIDRAPDIVPISLAASVGITDWWTASAFTSFRLKPDTEWRERIGLSTKVLAYDSARIDFAPGIYVPIDFDQEGNAHPFPAIALDATTRIHITKRHSLIIGQGLVPVSIGRRASLNLNYSLIIQAHPSGGLRLSSELFHIRLNGNMRESSFMSRLPAITIFRSIGNWLDLSATYGSYVDARGLFFSVVFRP